MSTFGSGRSELLWPMMLIVGALGMGLLVTNTPLRSHRPSAKQNIVTSQGASHVPARLWEDPFDSVARIWRSIADQELTEWPPGAISLQRFIELHDLKNAPGQRVLLLPVLTQDGGSPGLVDARISARYAIHAAMSVAGYAPSSPGEVSVVTVSNEQRSRDMDIAEADENTDFRRWLIPIDEYESADPAVLPDQRAQRYDRVFVLWVNMRELQRGSALRDLDAILALMTSDRTDAVFETAIIGPYFSGHLKGITAELSKRSDPFAMLNGMRMYSPWATASNTALGFEDREATELRGPHELALAFESDIFAIERTVGPDSDLLFLLTKELERRGIDALLPGKRNRKDHIAILSETDSLYGQSLIKEFVSHTRGDWSTGNESMISQYSYLRGLDGAGTRTGPSTSASPLRTSRSDSARQLADSLSASALAWSDVERAQGPSQVDYVRRLVERLQRDDRAWRRQGKRLRAIGVLGSDIYDKMIILKAMRQHFPDVLFFTTDLNAQMLHPADYRWTRNLIIASHYGLEAGPDLQKHVPPFRTSYQTALLVSVLKALGDMRVEAQPPPIGRIYEVGRYGAYDLTIDIEQRDPTSSADTRRWLAARPNIIPEGDFRRRTSKGAIDLFFPMRASENAGAASPGRLLIVLISSFVGFALLTFGYHTWTRSDLDPESATQPAKSGALAAQGKNARERSDWKTLFKGGLAAYGVLVGTPLLIMFVVVAPDHSRPGGEPFEILGGVSVWPTVLLRLFAGTLAIWFLHRIRVSLDRNAARIEADFGLPARTPTVEKGWIDPFLPREWLDRDWWRSRTTFGWNPKPNIKAVDLWSEYRDRTARRQRYLRTIPVLALYLAFGSTFFSLFGAPESPYRGDVSRLALSLSLLFAVITVNLLVFFVWDATRLCDRLIRFLSRRESHWPPETLRKIDRPHKVVSADRELQSTSSALESWIDCQVIARRTESVGVILYYPFIVLLVMIVARHNAIDNWSWNVPLLIVVTGALLVTVIAAATLRRSANIARERELERLRSVRANAIAKGDDGEALARVSEDLITEVKELRQGAFGGVFQNPIIGALLVPASGVGVIELTALLRGGV